MKMSEGKTLTYDEFTGLTLQELESDRALIRDVHFTIERAEKGSMIAVLLTELTIHNKKEGQYSSTSYVKAFQIDDRKHLYFFDNGSPIEYDDFLNPEDVIPSGNYRLNITRENKESALGLLETLSTSKNAYVMSPENMEKLVEMNLNEENVVAVMEPYRIRTPIKTMEELEKAIYYGEANVLELFEAVPIMFTNDLRRADRKKIERYNHKLKAWETIPGIPRYPIEGISKRIKNRLLAMLDTIG
jgi:hypothetical protein